MLFLKNNIFLNFVFLYFWSRFLPKFIQANLKLKFLTSEMTSKLRNFSWIWFEKSGMGWNTPPHKFEWWMMNYELPL